MAKGFGELFSISWKEYKQNIKYFVIMIFLCLFIPAIISYLLSIPFSSSIYALAEDASFAEAMQVYFSNAPMFVLGILVGILSFLLSVYLSCCLISSVLEKKTKISLKESLILGKKNFFRYFWYYIVFMLFLIGLFILFIIPGIIFGVFWVFSAYILIKEKKGIIESLKESKKLVNGRWWNTLGNVLLLIIIFIGISALISIIFGIVSAIIVPSYFVALFSGVSVPPTGIAWHVVQLLSLAGDFVMNIITIPLGILFLKNLYLDRKK